MSLSEALVEESIILPFSISFFLQLISLCLIEKTHLFQGCEGVSFASLHCPPKTGP